MSSMLEKHTLDVQEKRSPRNVADN